MNNRERLELIQWIYDYFNRQLFKKKLPRARIVFESKSRKSGVYLYRDSSQKQAYTLSLNIDKFYSTSPIDMVSIIVNQMVHILLMENNQSSRPGYCNKRWVAKMEEIGLVPSQNRQEGGKKTGQYVCHYIQAGGAFELAYNLLDEKVLHYLKVFIEGIPASDSTTPKRNKTKYSCPACSISTWGKPGLHLICGKCKKKLKILN